MNGRHHMMVAFGCSAILLPVGTVEGLVAGTLAVAFSHGALSPDVDQRLPLRHRGVTHQLEYVLLASVLVCCVAYLASAWYVGAGVALGWISHLLADALFGKGGRSIPMGIGVGARRVGTGLKCGGLGEWATARAFLALGLVCMVLRLTA